jgi:undecaprenyl-diphosphatase
VAKERRPLPTEIGRGRRGPHAWHRLAFNLTVSYVAAWVIGLGFGFGLLRTGRWDGGMAWERAVLSWFNAHPLPRALDESMVLIPFLGTNLVLIPLIIIAGWWLWKKKNEGWIAIQLLVVTLGSFTINPTMKHLLDRDRPALFQQRGMFNWESYPSGHLILTPALYFTIALLLWRARRWRWPFVVAFALVLVMSYSRLYLAVHWPTDLIGGALIGVVWLVGTWKSFMLHERRAGVREEEPVRYTRPMRAR